MDLQLNTITSVAEIQFGSWRGEASRISDKFVLIFHSFSGFFINMNKHKMAKIIYTTYQTNSFKIIKSMFIIYELPHAPVIFLINLGLFNCFENSDRAKNFRQTVPIYGWWRGGGCLPAPPEFPPLNNIIVKLQCIVYNISIFNKKKIYLKFNLLE